MESITRHQQALNMAKVAIDYDVKEEAANRSEEYDLARHNKDQAIMYRKKSRKILRELGK
jgi:hypothetical protein